jgi:hypothetical protein
MHHLAGVGEAGVTIISWAMRPARMAQIRRDPASEVVSVSPRRDLPHRVLGPLSVFRPFAHSLTTPSLLHSLSAICSFLLSAL